MHFDRRPLRLAVLQRVCPGYRTALFTKLSSHPEVDVRLFLGDDIPDSKVKSASDLTGISFRKMKTRFIRIGKRTLPWHVGLTGELRKFRPDVILCEGESHFLGYLQAILYKLSFGRGVSLIHWCFISLPGEPLGGVGLRAKIKAFFRRFFDAFLVYSSFSKDILLSLGQPGEKIFVATNVCDTNKFIKASDRTTESRSEARRKLGIPDRFTVLYTGTLDANKRPEIFLDLAQELNAERFNFVLLGTGPLLDALRERTTREGLSNVSLPGRVTDELPLYYRGADVLLVPGRGGIVISEAMAFGVPVIVHEADGTEHDLVLQNVTGVRLSKGDLAEFRNAIVVLAQNRTLCEKMSHECKRLIRHRFTTENMVDQIVKAAQFVWYQNPGCATSDLPIDKAA